VFWGQVRSTVTGLLATVPLATLLFLMSAFLDMPMKISLLGATP
jgi:hypothetical protein